MEPHPKLPLSNRLIALQKMPQEVLGLALPDSESE